MNPNNLSVVICEDAADAVAKGYDYKKLNVRPADLKKAVIVKKGTVGGRSTVDLIFEDEDGKLHVAMITGRLLKALPL